MNSDSVTGALFDLHCHPSLKYSLRRGEKFYEKHTPAGGTCGFIDPLGIYYDAPGTIEGGVKVLVNSHYVPENGFRRAKLLAFLSTFYGSHAGDVIEAADGKHQAGSPAPQNDSAWCNLMESIEYLHRLVDDTNNHPRSPSVHILERPSDFDTAVGKYDLVIVHGIEGAHHLGRHLTDPKLYVERLRRLREGWGVCVFTLSHFFLNDICDTAGGIPTSDIDVTEYTIPISPMPGLTPIGKQVVAYALQNGFLVDLVHSTPETRQQVYEINRNLAGAGPLRKLTPLAFTHTGVRELYRLGKDAAPESLSYLPDVDDMAAIKECNGIMGIILMKNWLNGEDDDHPLKERIIIETIDHINRGTGGEYKNVGIGTDLDGFTHVPDNLNHCSKLSELRKIILRHYGDEIAKLILYGNAARVFTETCC